MLSNERFVSRTVLIGCLFLATCANAREYEVPKLKIELKCLRDPPVYYQSEQPGFDVVITNIGEDVLRSVGVTLWLLFLDEENRESDADQSGRGLSFRIPREKGIPPGGSVLTRSFANSWGATYRPGKYKAFVADPLSRPRLGQDPMRAATFRSPYVDITIVPPEGKNKAAFDDAARMDKLDKGRGTLPPLLEDSEEIRLTLISKHEGTVYYYYALREEAEYLAYAGEGLHERALRFFRECAREPAPVDMRDDALLKWLWLAFRIGFPDEVETNGLVVYGLRGQRGRYFQERAKAFLTGLIKDHPDPQSFEHNFAKRFLRMANRTQEEREEGEKEQFYLNWPLGPQE